VTGAFSMSSVTTMRFIGVGMIIALVLDATVVRVLLVPAVLAVLGDASWWAPGPLRRLQEKAGLAEYAGEDEAAGRHAWQPGDPSLEETTVLDGTLLARALPATPAQAALPSGSDAPNTVVLDYEAVLDYLSEKERFSGTPSDDPVQQEATTPPDDLSPAGVADAGPTGPDDLWAEVEATLAAGAEITRSDTGPSLIEAYTEAQSPGDFDPSVTHVLHPPTTRPPPRSCDYPTPRRRSSPKPSTTACSPTRRSVRRPSRRSPGTSPPPRSRTLRPRVVRRSPPSTAPTTSTAGPTTNSMAGRTTNSTAGRTVTGSRLPTLPGPNRPSTRSSGMPRPQRRNRTRSPGRTVTPRWPGPRRPCRTRRPTAPASSVRRPSTTG
jgi:hypothetical protein